MIQIKRIYEPASDGDGLRILVDRIWPRGISRFDARIDHWEKEVAPTSDLRKWFGHKPERWDAFQKRYRAELKTNPAFDALRKQIGKKRTTLLYSARDTLRNQAVVLCAMLNEMPGKGVKATPAKAAPAKAQGKKAAPAKKSRAMPMHSASPVCYAEDADPAYMGYLSHDELTTFLNGMLEVTRAAMRATSGLGQPDATKKIRALLASLHQDESRWCAMLLGAIRGMGATPSPKTSDIYDKIVAASVSKERLALLGRNQAQIVCKLKEALPGVQDDNLYRDLRAMLAAHETNVRLIGASIAAKTDTALRPRKSAH